MRIEITPGRMSDYTRFNPIMADSLPKPSALLMDRGYDADNIRKSMKERDVLPTIRCGNPARCGLVWIGRSIACKTWSSAVSISSRIHVASPTATTQDPRKLSCLHRHHAHPLMDGPVVNMTRRNTKAASGRTVCFVMLASLNQNL